MGKKFLGLGGTDHFWDRAKAWILNQITSAVTAKIAEIVANAPEDLDTLKEIADWIKTHANDAAAMNTQIQTNKDNIAALSDDASAMNTQIQTNKDNIAANTSDISALKTSVAGKADKVHTHSAGDITSGALPVANGGTGASNGQTAFDNIVSGVRDSSNPVDDEVMLFRSTSWYKTTCLDFWNYIKSKISSVLGLTKDSYGGTAAAILDYNRNTPIKVRWGGPGINSAEWYPAFNADGSALEPINRTNLRAGTADYARNMYYQNFDLSSLDKTKFYPLVCYSANNFAEVAICSESGMYSMEYNQNRIHFDISTQGWSDLSPTLNIREYTCYENNEITIGCIGRGLHNGAWAIWLRGGLHYTCFSRDSDLSLHTSNYTFGDETYTVGTNYYGGSNTNVGIWFTPQSTIIEGAYSSRQIAAIEIKANNRMVIPIGAPSYLVDGCIWIER